MDDYLLHPLCYKISVYTSMKEQGCSSNNDKWDTGDRRCYTSVGWRSMVNICQRNLVADCQKLALNEWECGLYLVHISYMCCICVQSLYLYLYGYCMEPLNGGSLQ